MEIVVSHLSKTFGALRAVDDLSFTVTPGRVTGFLGPNGAGKTTTLRVALGLISASAGTATFDGVPYAELDHPMRQVGAALEASSFHPGRTAVDHLRMLAPLVGVTDARCNEVLEFVGLSDAAHRPVGQFSLGMRGRLGLAATLLGNPEALLLDEPNNGLDPEGIAWMRALLRHLADQGCAVLISSHMLSEVQQSVDDVVIINHGRLVRAAALTDLAELASERTTVVPSDGDAFVALCRAQGWSYAAQAGGFEVDGATAVEIGQRCFASGIEVYQLVTHAQTLENTFLAMTEQPEVVV